MIAGGSADWQGGTVGRKCEGYSNEVVSSLSSTARAVPLLPHGRRLFAPLALVAWAVLVGASMRGTLMSQ